MKLLVTLIRTVDALNEVVGRAVSWLTLVMVLIAFAVVILRYVFAYGFVWMQESYVWLHGVVFMVGAGYTLLHNGHVRVDVIYRTASLRYKAVIDLLGSLLLLLPLIIVVFDVSYGYVLESWFRLEESREAGGLPGLFLLKSVLLVFAILLGLQGLSLMSHSLLVLAGHEEYAAVTEDEEADTV